MILEVSNLAAKFHQAARKSLADSRLKPCHGEQSLVIATVQGAALRTQGGRQLCQRDVDLLAPTGDAHLTTPPFYVLDGGEVVRHGTVAEVAGDPAIRKAYLGVA